MDATSGVRLTHVGCRMRTSKQGSTWEARKATYDRRAKEAPLQLGDRVYLRHRVLGRNKIQDHWAPRVYKVIQVLSPEQGVYQVEPSDGSGPIRTVNRTEMRPCGISVVPPIPAPRRWIPQPRLRRPESVEESSSGIESGDEDSVEYWQIVRPTHNKQETEDTAVEPHVGDLQVATEDPNHVCDLEEAMEDPNPTTDTEEVMEVPNQATWTSPVARRSLRKRMPTPPIAPRRSTRRTAGIHPSGANMARVGPTQASTWSTTLGQSRCFH